MCSLPPTSLYSNDLLTPCNSVLQCSVLTFPRPRTAPPFESRLLFTGDTDSFKQNVEWDVEGFQAERLVSYYGCCPEPYPGEWMLWGSYNTPFQVGEC